MRSGPFWNRLAAATGIDFAVVVVALAILAEVKDIENTSDFVTASNEVWGIATLLLGAAAVSLLWFTSIFVARLRQVEDASGTSGRLANAVLGSGSAFSGLLVLAIAVQWAARERGAVEIAELGTAILEGPTLAFVAAPFVGAAGLAVLRAGPGVSAPSRIVAQLSLLVAPALIALGAIQMFNNYAWIDETTRLVFAVWVVLVSVIGVQRWGSIDEGWQPGTPPAPTERRGPVPLRGPEPLPGPERAVTASAPRARKPAARKKAAPRKKASPRKA